jgi:hypothetical protein
MADGVIPKKKRVGNRNDLTAEYVRSILHYSPDTGDLRWKWRPDRTLSWNAVWAGTLAGTRTKSGVRVKINYKPYAAHRLAVLIVTGKWPIDEIDHENLDKFDNRWGNLREATHDENMWNRLALVKNRSGLKGVSLCNGRWRARITIHRKHIFLGYFKTAIEAHAAYCEAAVRLHGKFARYGKVSKLAALPVSVKLPSSTAKGGPGSL